MECCTFLLPILTIDTLLYPFQQRLAHFILSQIFNQFVYEGSAIIQNSFIFVLHFLHESFRRSLPLFRHLSIDRVHVGKDHLNNGIQYLKIIFVSVWQQLCTACQHVDNLLSISGKQKRKFVELDEPCDQLSSLFLKETKVAS
jgi:hypothetical protein